MEETVPRYGDDYHILMIFYQNKVDLEFKIIQLCIEDELADGENPFASMQDALIGTRIWLHDVITSIKMTLDYKFLKQSQ